MNTLPFYPIMFVGHALIGAWLGLAVAADDISAPPYRPLPHLTIDADSPALPPRTPLDHDHDLAHIPGNTSTPAPPRDHAAVLPQ
jgi:hypothetical protein